MRKRQRFVLFLSRPRVLVVSAFVVSLAVILSTQTELVKAATSTLIQIEDVFGLSNELALRPTSGVGYAAGRAAIINGAGQIDGADGAPGDVVLVDGSSAPYSAVGPQGP